MLRPPDMASAELERGRVSGGGGDGDGIAWNRSGMSHAPGAW